MTSIYGPRTELGKEIHATKYRGAGESFDESMARVASALQDDAEHFQAFRSILLNQRFMPGGRIQAAVGSPRSTTPYNCFLSGTIEDSMGSIMEKAAEAAQTMRLGGGIGYDFSTLRPRGDRIVSLDSRSSGPVSFMGIFDAVCHTISSAGHRRGAQMGVLRIDHPDIEEFIRAKQNTDRLNAFNISIAVTDEFMEAVENDQDFDLKFDGEVYRTINAKNLWEEIMRSTWEWAEPGVLFVDTINRMNNLHYCEQIAATNPCAEQPLPPYGACLLGSFNLTRYITPRNGAFEFDMAQFEADIPTVVRAMDNVIDIAAYPLPEHEEEAHSKRRMGLGVTGVANAGEALGHPYGSTAFCEWLGNIMEVFRDGAYGASVEIAKTKGPFGAFSAEEYLAGEFIRTLPQSLRRRIKKHGIRNSHLLSIAPAGTISLAADNVSSGIEPVYSLSYQRTVQTPDGPVVADVQDYGQSVFKVQGKTATACTAQEHLDVLIKASQYVDSAVSKTLNVSPDMDWDSFKGIYVQAWRGGAKGCTTFNPGGKRFGILQESSQEPAVEESCVVDPVTGAKSCG